MSPLNCRKQLGQHIFLLAGQPGILLRKTFHCAVGTAQLFPLFQLDKAHLRKRIHRIAAVAYRFPQRRQGQLV